MSASSRVKDALAALGVSYRGFAERVNAHYEAPILTKSAVARIVDPKKIPPRPSVLKLVELYCDHVLGKEKG